MPPDRSDLRLPPPYRSLDRQAWVGRLARTVAHQIASPLTALVVTSEYLAAQLPKGEQAHADAMELHRAAVRCSELLESFRELARRERGPQPTAIDLGQVIVDLRPLLEHALMISRLTLDAELPADLQPVRAHRADVEHLLVRLLFGAVDQAPAGARVHVAAQNEGSRVVLRVGVEAGAVRSTAAAGAHARGRPVDPRQDRAAAAAPLLNGLGLAACEELATELDGRLELEGPQERAGAQRRGARLSLPAWG